MLIETTYGAHKQAMQHLEKGEPIAHSSASLN